VTTVAYIVAVVLTVTVTARWLTDITDNNIEALAYGMLAGFVVYYRRVARIIEHAMDQEET